MKKILLIAFLLTGSQAKELTLADSWNKIKMIKSYPCAFYVKKNRKQQFCIKERLSNIGLKAPNGFKVYNESIFDVK